MVMRFMAVLFIVLAFTGLSYAAPLSFSAPCDQGGQITGTGDYNPASGVITLNATLTNCVNAEGRTLNGTAKDLAASTDQYLPQTGFLSLALEYDLTVTEGGSAITIDCIQSFDGNYNDSNGVFTGNVSGGCGGTGSISLSPINLFIPRIIP